MPQRQSNLDHKTRTNSKVKDFPEKNLPHGIHFEHLVKVDN